MCQPLVYGLQVSRGTIAKLQNFTDMISGFIMQSLTDNAFDVARKIIADSGVHADIFSGNTVEDKSRQENVQELMNAISDFVDMQREEGSENDKLIDYINSVQLLTDIDTDEADGDDHITLMTVHSAKGLEFPAIFVVGLEEELFPNAMAQNSMRELEEERRLFYVAITRAKDFCMLSFAKSRYKYGSFEFCEPSRFIKEIDQRFMQFSGGAQRAGQARQASYKDSGLFTATNSRELRERDFYRPKQETPQPQRIQTMSMPVQSASRLQRVSDAVRSGSAQPSVSCGQLAIGDIVSHERFGIGQVLHLEGTGENAKAKIKFKNAGEKTLLLKFAKLSVVK